jgi:hypothetical protein
MQRRLIAQHRMDSAELDTPCMEMRSRPDQDVLKAGNRAR